MCNDRRYQADCWALSSPFGLGSSVSPSSSCCALAETRCAVQYSIRRYGKWKIWKRNTLAVMFSVSYLCNVSAMHSLLDAPVAMCEPMGGWRVMRTKSHKEVAAVEEITTRKVTTM